MIRRSALAVIANLFFLTGPIAFATAGPDAIGSDSSTVVTLESSVKNVEWDKRQLTLTLAVPNGKGGTSLWTVRGPGTAALARLGWTSQTIKVGDQLDVVAYSDKSGTRSASLLRLIFADGRTLEALPNGDGAVAPASLKQPVLTREGLDPLAGYYGNTVICKGPTFDCHTWFDADHHFIMFSRDQTPDGSSELRGREGTWWLQKLEGAYFMCFVFDGVTLAPICHSPVNFETVGDTWETILPNGVHETKRLIAGRH